MPNELMLMHNDPPKAARDDGWATCIQALAKTGKLRGGSAIGGGVCRRKSGAAPPVTAPIGGFHPGRSR